MSELEGWTGRIVSVLGLSRYCDMPESASRWKAGHNSDGTLDAFRRRRDDGGVGGVIRHESDDAPLLVR